jgi:tRNA nucleotidyltransferase/poly(A) polymerase
VRLTTADWLTAPGPQAVMAMLEDGGHQALAVGGCVRNALLGAPVTDVDIATDARPERVMDLAEAAGLKAIPTGIDHGTVTVVADHTGHEVTTFRADVETDGRHAVVRFSDDATEDARRRDFTMNALYCDRRGEVVDPLGGLPDLHARRLRFIEDPGRRIREDYLRILRFFRFSAWYADPAGGIDPEALAAIASNLDGLSRLSRERVGSEIVKLMAAPDPAPVVAAMAASGALGAVLHGADATPLAPLVHMEAEAGVPPAPMRRLAALGQVDPAMLRLSKAQARRLAAIDTGAREGEPAHALGYRLGAETARDALLVRAALMGAPINPADLAAADDGARAEFPVRPRDLMPDYEGAALGRRLSALEEAWIASRFTLDRAALLAL